MRKAIDFINFIKVNKLEEVEFANGYDDNYCLTFVVKLDEKHEIMYEFVQKGKQGNKIRLFTYYEDEQGDFNMDEDQLTTDEALKMRGLK